MQESKEVQEAIASAATTACAIVSSDPTLIKYEEFAVILRLLGLQPELEQEFTPFDRFSSSLGVQFHSPGLYIADVASGSLASEASIKPGEVLVSFNGKKVFEDGFDLQSIFAAISSITVPCQNNKCHHTLNIP
jgi:S1-C subfamily serine protease